MDEEIQAKLDLATGTVLHLADRSKRPWSHANAYLSKLRADPDWSDVEIIELQRRVIAAILYREQEE